MFISRHTLKWTKTCRSSGDFPHAHTAHFLLNRHRPPTPPASTRSPAPTPRPRDATPPRHRRRLRRSGFAVALACRPGRRSRSRPAARPFHPVRPGPVVDRSDARAEPFGGPLPPPGTGSDRLGPCLQRDDGFRHTTGIPGILRQPAFRALPGRTAQAPHPPGPWSSAW